MDKKEKKKPESSRLNLFYIVQVLAKYTDEKHPMSASEIAKQVNIDFAHLPLKDVKSIISPDTVKRTIDEMVDVLFLDPDHNVMAHEYGYCIVAVMKNKKGSYEEYCYPEDKEKEKAPKKYYYLEHDLKIPEILTLKDAIEAYNYWHPDDITEIVQKLLRFQPMSVRTQTYKDIAERDREEDSVLLMNIEDLHRIILNHHCAKITYCSYGADKKLTPRPGYPKIVEPVHLMWSNGYYYLLAYNRKYNTIVNFRIDRITSVEEVEEENYHLEASFNPVKYRHEHPVMFGGKTEHIVLLCRDTGKNYFMNTIMDVFGKDARVREAEEDLIEQYLPYSKMEYKQQGITWLRVDIESVASGVELWATQYCNDCIIVSPEESRERVKQRLLAGYEYYNKK